LLHPIHYWQYQRSWLPLWVLHRPILLNKEMCCACKCPTGEVGYLKRR
jgi:hypothetical protein